VSIEARELHRIISASVRDMLDAYRLQAQAGPVSDKALEGLVVRAAHPVSVANTKGRWALPRAGWRRRMGRTWT